MANHVSALKRARQTEVITERNRANTSRLRTALRGLREAIDSGDKKAAEKIYASTASVIDAGSGFGRSSSPSKGRITRKWMKYQAVRTRAATT